jgi:hypothetical protein
MTKEIGWKRLLRSAIVCATLLSMATPRSLAWGREGHRLTALVAQQYLTAETRAQIAELLHGESIADIASWADEYRNEAPGTAPWHFVDIPGSAASFDRNRDCPVSASDAKSPWRDCVTDRILYFEGRLGDTELAPKERAMALKFLVHLIGDIHQPFHAIGDARGGNDIKLTFLGSRQCGTSSCNVHEVWDSELIDHQGLSETAYVARLMGEIKQNGWERLSGGEPTSWANASHHYAVLAQAPNGAMLMSDYVGEESKIVDAELALGGLRLAHVLNRILAAPEDESQRKPLTNPHP